MHETKRVVIVQVEIDTKQIVDNVEYGAPPYTDLNLSNNTAVHSRREVGLICYAYYH